MKKINFKKNVWEGWTVGDFVNELEPQLNIIMSGKSWKKINTKEELKTWITDNQPYYKKYIPDVFNYFVDIYKEKLV